MCALRRQKACGTTVSRCFAYIGRLARTGIRVGLLEGVGGAVSRRHGANRTGFIRLAVTSRVGFKVIYEHFQSCSSAAIFGRSHNEGRTLPPAGLSGLSRVVSGERFAQGCGMRRWTWLLIGRWAEDIPNRVRRRVTRLAPGRVCAGKYQLRMRFAWLCPRVAGRFRGRVVHRPLSTPASHARGARPPATFRRPETPVPEKFARKM